MIEIIKIKEIKFIIFSYIELRVTKLENILLSLFKYYLLIIVVNYSFK